VVLSRLVWVFVAVAAAGAGSAAEGPETVRVATRLIPPFVFEEKGTLTGFSVDLWHAIADPLKLKSEFVVAPTVKDLLAAIREGKADAGIAAISITAERSREFDFSQPMFDSGLQILIRAQPGATGWLPGFVALVFTKAVFPLIGLIALCVLVPAHVVWFAERRHPAGIVRSKSYFPGIFEACWWAAATLATQADEMPKSALGRLVAVVWMFAAVVFVAYFTASVTASLTLQQLQADIKGPEDLPGKEVATTVGSTSAAYLKQMHIAPREFSRIDEAFAALLAGEADAVVFDAPVLLYFAAREGKGRVQLVGPVFRKESYGIVFPPGSRLRKPVDAALLTLKENGTYQRLYDKWFGAQ
jgi:polar amino acid transport system substrate-binding protein